MIARGTGWIRTVEAALHGPVKWHVPAAEVCSHAPFVDEEGSPQLDLSQLAFDLADCRLTDERYRLLVE